MAKEKPMRVGVNPHRLFSLYIAVQILKNIIGKGLAFLGIQSYNMANMSEYFVFFSLHRVGVVEAASSSLVCYSSVVHAEYTQCCTQAIASVHN